MKRKLRSGRGTTMVELLAAVLVLILLSMMLSTGLNLALNSYHRMIAHSECQVLLSTAADTLINELRFARDMELDMGEGDDEGRLVSYRSRTVGCVGNIITWNGTGSIPDVPDVGQPGQLYVKEIDPEEPYTPAPLLSSGAYGANGSYQIKLPTGITYNPTNKIFTFTIQVYDGEELRAEGAFSARCLGDN